MWCNSKRGYQNKIVSGEYICPRICINTEGMHVDCSKSNRGCAPCIRHTPFTTPFDTEGCSGTCNLGLRTTLPVIGFKRRLPGYAMCRLPWLMNASWPPSPDSPQAFLSDLLWKLDVTSVCVTAFAWSIPEAYPGAYPLSISYTQLRISSKLAARTVQINIECRRHLRQRSRRLRHSIDISNITRLS